MMPALLGAYRCLLSYYNQMDHDFIDRRDDEVTNLPARFDHRQEPRGRNKHSEGWLGQGARGLGISEAFSADNRWPALQSVLE